MNNLTAEIAAYIEFRMKTVARTLQGPDVDLRTVFHGPPRRFLEPLLERFQSDGGLVVQLGDGISDLIPVLLPVEQLADRAMNPPVGTSGHCDPDYLLSLRNTPACPRYLALVGPAAHSILSIAQATDHCGLQPDNNSGSASAKDWWEDDFVQGLVGEALQLHPWRDTVEREGARQLLEAAILAADEADRHDPQRLHSWAALSRVLSISDTGISRVTQWSLACGFPPGADGRIHAKEQRRVLGELVETIVEEGYSSCAERLKRNATEEEVAAIEECFDHLQIACEVPLALSGAAPYYYGPCTGEAVEAPPDMVDHPHFGPPGGTPRTRGR